MANEISVNIRVTVANGLYNDAFPPIADRYDQAAIGEAGGVAIVGFAAEEDLTFGDVATAGFIQLINVDDTNYVTYGPKSSGAMVPFGRIKPGEPAFLRLEPGITWRWQAHTANVKIKWRLLEN